MKRIFSIASILVLSALAISTQGIGSASPNRSLATPSPTPSSAAAIDVSGKWNLVANADPQIVHLTLDLKQNGTDVTGTMTSDIGASGPFTGKLKENMLTGKINSRSDDGQTAEVDIDGKIDGDKMSGTFATPFGPAPFTGSRAK